MPTKREMVIWPRFIATLVLGFLLTVFSTTLFAWWAVGPLRLQPIMVVVVAAGFYLPLGLGGILVLFFGCISDLLSGGVIGLQLSAYMVVFLCCAMAQRQIEIHSWPLQMMAVAVMSLVAQLLVVGGLYLIHREQLVPVNLMAVAAAQAALTALTAPLFFTILEALVRLTVRLWPKERRAG
jgi:rod shape-determining protein MreD